MVAARAVVVGVVVLLAGTIPRNLLFAANLRHYPGIPWAVPVTALWVWCVWRYLQGAGPPKASAETRRRHLRANPVSGKAWAWALFAGGLGIVALVLALRLANRLVALPQQQLPNLDAVPDSTMAAFLLTAAPIAGIVEEAAFRGHMQGPIERHHGLAMAILITGTMFAVVHLDFTLILWPYYLAVAAIYGSVTYLTNSILPAIVLHTAGNLYSNFDLWLHGQAEWQASASAAPLVTTAGADWSFWMLFLSCVAVATVMGWGYSRLAHATVDLRNRANGFALSSAQRY